MMESTAAARAASSRSKVSSSISIEAVFVLLISPDADVTGAVDG